MADDQEAEERLYTSTVPRGIVDAKKIVFGRTFEDFMILLLLYGVSIGLSVFGVLSGIFTIGAFIISTVAMAIVYRLAGDTSVVEYLNGKKHRARLPSRVRASFEPDGGSGEYNRLRPDGGRFENQIEDLTEVPNEIQVWKEDVGTAEFTRVKNVYPGFDVIERADGVFITALEVQGTSVFLRSKPEQNQLAAEFGRRAGDIGAPFSVFMTTKPYDVQSHKETHMDARRHEVVQESPILRALHHDYQENIINDSRVKQTRRRDIYIVTAVSPDDVEPREMGDGMEASLSDRVREMFQDSTDHTREELLIREAAFKKLEKQKSKIQRLFSGIDEVEIRDVDYQTHLGEIRGHWRGPIDSDPVEVPASPIVPPKGMLEDVETDDDGGLLA